MTRKITKSNQSEQRSDRGAKRSDRGGAYSGAPALHPYGYLSAKLQHHARQLQIAPRSYSTSPVKLCLRGSPLGHFSEYTF